MACFALAVALGDAKPRCPLVIVLLVIAGLARLLIPVFPTDQNGSRWQTVPGTIHMILAIVIFAAIIFAASKLGSTLEHRPAWHGVKGWLNVLPWVMTGGAVGTLVAMRSRFKRCRAVRTPLLRRLDRVVLHRRDRTSTHLLARPGRPGPPHRQSAPMIELPKIGEVPSRLLPCRRGAVSVKLPVSAPSGSDASMAA